MKNQITTFIKTYFLNILLVVVFVGIFVLTQFAHNVHVYKWLFIEYITGFGYEGEIASNIKTPLQEYLLALPLIVCSVLVDYFRSLFYPKEDLTRIFIVWATLFIIFFINWTIFELFGSMEYESLYSPKGTNHISEDFVFNTVNKLLIMDMVTSLMLMAGVLVLEKLTFFQKFSTYIKNLLLKFGDTNQV